VGVRGKQKNEPLPHNQWQVGNFVAQKQLKAGGQGAFKLVLGKSCFWLWLWVTANPFGWAIGFWQKQKQVKAKPKSPENVQPQSQSTARRNLSFFRKNLSIFGGPPYVTNLSKQKCKCVFFKSRF
jgi:hypothetical protein